MINVVSYTTQTFKTTEIADIPKGDREGQTQGVLGGARYLN